MTTKRTGIVTFAALALATLSLAATADAQPYGRGPGPGMMGQGMMMGPAMMGPRSYNRMCHPSAAGFAQWRIDRIEQAIKPTDAQRAKLDELKAASSKAAEVIRDACPTDAPPTTTVARMAAMEKRLDAMAAAVKTVRPALEAFYATLTDEQKARLDSNSRRSRSWHRRW